MIEPILIVGIAIVCTVWYMRHRWRRRAWNRVMQKSTGLEVLEERYACGEIDRDEYLMKKGDIVGYPVVTETTVSETTH